MIGLGTNNGSQSITFSSKDTLIWSMTMIRVLNPEAPWPSSPVIAAECGLWYCVKNYDSMVKDGNLIEVESPAPSMKSNNSWHLFGYPSSGVESQVKNTETLSFGISSVYHLTDLQLDDRFNVSQPAVYGISSFMNTTFTQANYQNIIKDERPFLAFHCSTDGYSDYSNSVLDKGINAYFGHGNDSTINTSTGMPFLYNSQDLNATFATLAKSMTNSIRENSDGNLVMIGKTGILHVVYRIH